MFEDPERSGYSLFECRITRGTHITLSEFPKGIQIKSAQSAPGPQKKSTRCAPGHEITTILLIFNCKKCDFFPQKFQHKNERSILPLRSDISYKTIGNTVHLWHNIEHALCIL